MHRDVVGPRVPLMININIDDETLMQAFGVWLAGVRASLGGKRAETEYTDEHFRKWREFKILQVFDLDLWKEITSANYTDAFIARQLWPDNDPSLGAFDRTDRLRRVSRKIINELVHPWECERLVHETRLHKFLEKIIEEKKAGKEPESAPGHVAAE